MKKIIYSIFAFMLCGISAKSQFVFDPSINVDFSATTVVLPPSPLQYQILFVGGVDKVQTLDNNGVPNGEATSKQWHDFIGITPDNNSNDIGWISINHEMIYADDSLGDGGGMTVFKLGRDANTDSLVIVNQTLNDGRAGKFFNVDFANTVGETGMNCGGISSSYDGRIWTAEEWFRSSNASIYTDYWGNLGVQDTSDFTITNSGIACADGQTVPKYQNFNYMVEIDPREAMAIRKQYNWGRQPFEGGCILPDNKTVFIGQDNTPGFLTKFVANTPGDFTQGKTYVFKEDNNKPSLSHTTVIENLAAEIVSYDLINNYAYTTDAGAQSVQVHSFANDQFSFVHSIDLSSYGDEPTSVAVHNGIAAISIVNATGVQGSVVFADNTGAILGSVTAGFHPDMITFSPDGNYVLAANEGEPSDDYTLDPIGSVSVIDVSNGFTNATVTDIEFSSYNSQQQALEAQGVRIFGQQAGGISSTVAEDLEPEYIAIDANSQLAYVACQENNAIAVIDIASATVVNLFGLGYKDYSLSVNAIDPSDDDGISGNFNTYPVFGMYQPDALSIFETNGNTYIISANEGDARDYSGYSEEYRLDDFNLDPNAFPNASYLQNDSVLGRLKVSDVNADIDGDGDVDIIYSYGGRSFSIWDQNGYLIYDSGNEIARKLLELRPDNFPDNRSDDKGSEPESIEVGQVDGRWYAFIGLERATGVMVYDITDPANAFFVDYFNNDATDLSPEGLDFASINGENYLFVGNESFGSYGGSLSAYKINGGSNQTSNWVEIDNTDFNKMLNYTDAAVNARATMFNRVEWVVYNEIDEKVYFTCTGRDNPFSKWADENYEGAVHAAHNMNRAAQQGTHPNNADYVDYYGRIMQFDPATDQVSVFLEAGPDYAADSIPLSQYPDIHLSNPDGLNFIYIDGHPFMLICEDLNGSSHGRVPGGQTDRTCELYMLDMEVNTPTINDLIRISQVPIGAEITGAVGTPDGKSILINSQHPSSSNPYPYNNSLTYAINGFDKLLDDTWLQVPDFSNTNEFQIFPNPTSREIMFNYATDIAIYDMHGKRIMVKRNVSRVDVSNLNPGVYFVRNSEGNTQKLVVE